MNKNWIMVGAAIVSLMFQGVQAMAADTYQIDPAHSSIGFSLKHLTVSTVTGSFTDYFGTVDFDKADPAAFKADVTIKATSINTNQQKRDEHLRTEDFFDVAKFPEIFFKSKKAVQQGDGYLVTGDLTLHGVTKEISIPVTISGPIKSPMGSEVIGLFGETTINRKDYGITWNKALDSGGLMVGEDVKVSVNLEAQKK